MRAHKWLWLFGLLALFRAGTVSAAPFAQANVDAATTQCGFYLDTGAVVVVPAVGGRCRLDLAFIAVGAHVVSADARGNPMWVTNSARTGPLNFSRPAPPTVPTGLVIAP